MEIGVDLGELTPVDGDRLRAGVLKYSREFQGRVKTCHSTVWRD
jgi:hypothetical protein